MENQEILDLWTENLDWARNVVRKLMKGYKDPGLIEDAVSEAWILLGQCAEKFDPSRGCSFRTYAYWAMRAACSKAVKWWGRGLGEEGGLYRQEERPWTGIGEWVEGLGKKDRMILEMYYEEGYTDKEIAEELGVSQAHVNIQRRKLLEKLYHVAS